MAEDFIPEGMDKAQVDESVAMLRGEIREILDGKRDEGNDEATVMALIAIRVAGIVCLRTGRPPSRILGEWAGQCLTIELEKTFDELLSEVAEQIATEEAAREQAETS